jgi:flagellar motor switch protein FliM
LAEILTQEEIDALLGAISSGDLETDSTGLVDEKSVSVYDFRRPDRFSKDQTRTLHMIHQTFARLYSTSLSTSLRTLVDIKLVSIDQLTYDEFIRSIPNPSFINIIQMTPLEGSSILQFSPKLSFIILDRLLGGQGNELARNRELTEIEISILKKIVDKALDELGDSWSAVMNLNAELEACDINPQIFVQLYLPSEMAIMMTFEVFLAGNSAVMSFCLPYVMMEPIVHKLNSKAWFSASVRDKDQTIQTAIKKSLSKVAVEMIAELGETEINVSDIMELKAGDVIKLGKRADAPIPIKIQDKVKFLCIPGARGKNMALQIVSREEEEGGFVPW